MFNKRWSFACYLPVINCLTCLFAAVKAHNDPVTRFHVRQGLVLFALMFANSFLIWIFYWVGVVVWFLLMFLHLVELFFVANGKVFEIPLLSRLAKKIPEYYFFEALTGKSINSI